MSQIRRVRRESARQQAQQRLRRLVAARERQAAGTPWQRIRRWASGRRPWYLLVALFLAAIIGIPIFSQGPINLTGTPTPGAAVSPAATALPSEPPPMRLEAGTKYGAAFQTSKGRVRFDLFADALPSTVNNVVTLARQGFYGNTYVYDVRPDRVFFGARNEDGTGTPGYTLPLEGQPEPVGVGSIVIVPASDGMVSSQMYIALTDVPEQGIVVGKLSDGLDIARQLAKGDKILAANISESK